MEYRQIEAFVSVVTEHSFTRAADKLSLTQPAVSRQIAALEDELGAVLLDRMGRRVELTASGRTLFAYAQEIMRLNHEACKAVADMSARIGGRLIVGASSTAATYLLPCLLRLFHERFPEVEVGIRTGPSPMIANLVAANEVDVGIVMDYDERSHLTATPLAPYVSMIIVYPDHPIHRHMKSELLPAALNGQEFILMQKGASLRSYAEGIFSEASINVEVTMELDSVEAIKKMIEARMGISFLPFMAVEQEVAVGKLAAIALSGAHGAIRNISVVVRDDKYQPLALEEFISLLTAELKEHPSLMPSEYEKP